MRILYACGDFEPGQVYDRDEKIVNKLLKTGYAERVDPTIEVAMAAAAPETAMANIRPKRRVH